MKKIMVLLALGLMVSATSVMAASTITGQYSNGELTFNVSNGVAINVDSTSVAYTAMAMHKSGSRCFLTDQIESKVYWVDATITVDGGNIAAASWPEAPAAGASSTEHGTPDPTTGSWKPL